MRSRLALSLLMLLIFGAHTCFAQTKIHKSENEIAHLTPEGLVRERCAEYYHHGLIHREYMDLLFDHFKRAGLKTIPEITRIINEFDPTSRKANGRDKDDAASEAEILLGSLDRSFRVRAFDGGREAIQAIRREAERMLQAHFDTAPSEGEYSRQSRYEATLDTLQELQGASMYDESIRDTLELKQKIKMSDKELVEFSNYLTSQDPYYPTWSETEWYVDHDKPNEAGNPHQYSILKNVEPFYKAYLKYKAKGR